MRPCEQCSVCCIDLALDERPAGTACRMLACHGRCSTYSTRPPTCRAYECLWRLLDADVLTAVQRPDRIGAVFTPRFASELGLPLRGGGDWLVVVASPASLWGPSRQSQEHLRGRVADNSAAMEAVRRLRLAGLHVLLSETLPAGPLGTLEPPLRPPTREFAQRLATALEGRLGESLTVGGASPPAGDSPGGGPVAEKK